MSTPAQILDTISDLLVTEFELEEGTYFTLSTTLDSLGLDRVDKQELSHSLEKLYTIYITPDVDISWKTLDDVVNTVTHRLAMK